MKAGSKQGEYEVLDQLGVDFKNYGRAGLLGSKNIRAEDRLRAKRLLMHARQVVSSGSYDLVVLDEANTAATWQLFPTHELLDLIKNKAPNTELIITGRDADEKIVEAADLVTDLHNVKHPFDRGLPARAGFDY